MRAWVARLYAAGYLGQVRKRIGRVLVAIARQRAERLKLADQYGNLHRTRLVKHGDNALSFYGQVATGG